VHDFAVTHVNADGTVPADPEPPWQVHNVYRARPAVDDPAGADLTVRVTDLCVASCEHGPVKIAFQVQNEGAVSVDAGTSWAFYRQDDDTLTLVTSGTLTEAIEPGRALKSLHVEVHPSDLGSHSFAIRIDDDGAGGDAVIECDEDDNLVLWNDRICQ